MENPVTQATPSAIAISLTSAGATAVANHVANAPLVMPDVHEVATYITIVSGSLSILMTSTLAIGWLIHLFAKKKP